MKFRAANSSDIPEIMKIILNAKESIKTLGIDQWQKGKPDEMSISNDISNGESFLIEMNGVIIATAALVRGIDEAYEKIYEGEWTSNAPYCSIHRIAVLDEYQKEGSATILLQHLENHSRAWNLYDLRIDTHPENFIMLKWIAKNGFEYCGKVDLTDGMRLAYQKDLRK